MINPFERKVFEQDVNTAAASVHSYFMAKWETVKTVVLKQWRTPGKLLF
jgi:hypothetical protein